MNKHLKRLAVAIASLMVGIIIGGTAAVANSWITGAVDGEDLVVSGCVIRFSNADGTPSIHANGAHQCAGVKSVDINKYGEVRVWQTVDTVAKYPILFAQCQADETLGGQRGIICGASGGTDNTRFRLYDTQLGRNLDLNKQADRDRVQHRNANLWVGWFHKDNA